MIDTLKKLFGIGPSTDFKALMAQGAQIIDVRSPGEYSGGHIKGSINMPLNQLSSQMSKLKNKNQIIITCCASGMRSASAKSLFKQAGFAEVYNGGGWFSLNNKIK